MLTQAEVGHRGQISQSMVSLAERGHIDRLSLAMIRSIFAVVDARFEGNVSWRGGAVDRLLDERHARLSGAIASRLRRLGWLIEIEVTFNEFGDRGSIDILAVRSDGGVALVVEIKTEITSVEETVRRLDVKERLAPKIVFERTGARPRVVGRLLVLMEGSTNRRRATRHGSVLLVALPQRGREVRAWLRRPSGRLSGLLFSSSSDGRGTRRR